MPDSNIRLILCLKTVIKGNTDQKEILPKAAVQAGPFGGSDGLQKTKFR